MRGPCRNDKWAAPVSILSTSTIEPCHLSTFNHVFGNTYNTHVIDLYMIGDDTFTHLNGGCKTEKPFIHEILIHDAEGNMISAPALFDRGTIVSAISLGLWQHIKQQLSGRG